MEICAIGGYEGVGKNMTAVKIKEDVFIFDCGLNIPGMMKVQSDMLPQRVYSEKELRRAGAIPEDRVLDKKNWRSKVRAIIIGHAHLDHVGAVPHLAYRYPKAKILGTPFTMAVLETLIKDERRHLRNKRIIVKENSAIKLRGKSGTYKIEFIHVTHSTLQTASVALHTKEGIFYYALDFKFDDTPVLEKASNYKRIRQVGEKGVKVLVIEALYSSAEGRTPSEMVARKKLQSAMDSVKDRNSAFFVTTFSSHIARLKSIVDFAARTNRKIVFLGRSLDKYTRAAIKVKKCPFQHIVSRAKYRNDVNSVLREIERNRGKYLVVCTGHQAEENSILDRITRGQTPFKFRQGDNLIFASSIIPVPGNILAREKMDAILKKQGVKIKKDLHVSGHAYKEDLKMLIKMLKPKHIIPTHGTHEQELPMIRLAQKLGYAFGKNVHLFTDGKLLNF